MISYQTNKEKLSGIRYAEVRNQALFIFGKIKKRTKRKPYIRSAYFKKQNKQSETFYRFKGLTKNKEQFWVQIKENKQSNKKYFISCFPAKSK